jgi:hypothetical protein
MTRIRKVLLFTIGVPLASATLVLLVALLIFATFEFRGYLETDRLTQYVRSERSLLTHQVPLEKFFPTGTTLSDARKSLASFGFKESLSMATPKDKGAVSHEVDVVFFDSVPSWVCNLSVLVFLDIDDTGVVIGSSGKVVERGCV